jgi:2-desacetyl-2-hydroxyethyl bacteriochlorophyllide A dehydrogenase
MSKPQQETGTVGKAIVAVGDGVVEIQDISVRPLGEWDIRVQLERSAISVGTESHIVGKLAIANNPMIPGYAPVARIEAIGTEAATLFSTGDRVSYFCPAAPLNIPGNCCGGHQSPALLNVNPETRDLLGADQYCIKVPDDLSSEKAAFGGISAVSSMGASMPGTLPGDKVLVLGQGLIGQFAAQHFRLRGAEVAVSDIDDKRLQISAACGADHLIHAAQQETASVLREIWPDGADIIADTTGSHRVIESSLPAIKRRGRYVFLGWCKGADFAIERLQAQTIFQAFFPWTLEGPHVQHSWRMMQQGGLKTDPLITHRAHFSEAPGIYEMMQQSPENHLGIVLNWDQ